MLTRFSQMRFSVKEFSGSLGDLGLFIPLVVAVCITTDMNLAIVLIAAGLMNVATGILFNQPIPVQPMKAIAAVAIAEGLTSGQIAASGMLIGLILLVITFSGLLQCLVKRIPLVLIRGIQLGVGLKLIILAVEWGTQLSWTFGQTSSILPIDLPWLSIGVLSVAVLIVLLLSIGRSFPTLLLVFLMGVAIVYVQAKDQAAYAFNLDWLQSVSLIIPSYNDIAYSFWYAVLPQLPLTLLNSVIAICALSADYFPKKGITTDKMASSVAWMNIICSPFGALPMCHGASGLAAQYQFGARTGGSIVMLGLFKIILGVVLGGSILIAMSAYPKFILAPLLVIAGLALCKSAWKEWKRLNVLVLFSTTGGILFVNTLFGFALGIAVYIVYQIIFNKKEPTSV